ncbi:D-alanine--D-alanine ligase family protein [Sanguibacter sp. 25GB23B1]|uniref:D-alanine--D-alanine ligase family protein n=1 Tax=unclassified Sanguibacter TaxID=2645534 RepID=UPI0032AEF206
MSTEPAPQQHAAPHHDGARTPGAEVGAHGVPPGSTRPRVVLLFGGRSGEHVISCATAAGVMRAIDRDRFDVIPVGITRRGQWVLAADDPDAWQIRDGHLPEVADADNEVILPLAVDQRALRVLQPGELPRVLGEVDVVFPLLHGPFGEDGTVQGMLEMVDVRYVGAGVLASAVGMDKHFMKLVLAGQGLPVAPFTVIRAGEWEGREKAWTESIANLGLPVFVKPARAGSSLGISKVTDLADLPAAIAEARRHDPKVIVEAGVVGREIECAVLGGRAGQRARASLPGEIEVTDEAHGFYDFEAKYLSEASVVLTCPADLPQETIDEVREIAVRTFEAVAGEGLSRVDVFVTDAGEVVVNEINTMPGFTPFSMYPRMWEATGLSYPDLITELLELALERPTGLR